MERVRFTDITHALPALCEINLAHNLYKSSKSQKVFTQNPKRYSHSTGGKIMVLLYRETRHSETKTNICQKK